MGKEINHVPYESKIIGWLHKNMPADFFHVMGPIDEDAKVKLSEIEEKMRSEWKPSDGNGRERSFDSYFYKYARLRLLRHFMDRYAEFKFLRCNLDELTEECERDERDGHTRHRYLKLHPLFDQRKQIGTVLEENDIKSLIRDLAKRIGYDELLKMVFLGYTESEIAKATQQSQQSVSKKLKTLARIAHEKFLK